MFEISIHNTLKWVILWTSIDELDFYPYGGQPITPFVSNILTRKKINTKRIVDIIRSP